MRILVLLREPSDTKLENNANTRGDKRPKHTIRSSGTIKYGNIKIHLIKKKNEISEDQKTKKRSKMC
jgi:hypothetical protein